MTRAAIIAGLIRFARAIGRWLLRFILRHGGSRLIGYMLGKVDDFKRRLGRAKTARRRTWLRGRIRRWQRAVTWLQSRWQQLVTDMVKEADDMAAELPMVAAAEREGR